MSHPLLSTNPFDAFAAVVMPVAETAVVSPLPMPPDTAANPIPEPTASERRSEQVPAVDALNPHEAAGTSDARWEGRLWLVLAEVLAFPPIDLDEPPLFLQAAAE